MLTNEIAQLAEPACHFLQQLDCICIAQIICNRPENMVLFRCFISTFTSWLHYPESEIPQFWTKYSSNNKDISGETIRKMQILTECTLSKCNCLSPLHPNRGESKTLVLSQKYIITFKFCLTEICCGT